jgi:hypothetical protein
MVETSLVRRGEVIDSDARAAVASFAAQVSQPDMAGVLFFCSANYDLDIVAEAMRAHFDCPVVGCTTAGEIASTYQRDGIVGASFPASHFRLHPQLITSMRDFGLSRASMLCGDVERRLIFSQRANFDTMFGLLLVDGLSLLEERVISNLYNAFNGMPIVGGSAGDDLQFAETLVYVDGQFHQEAAVLTVIETKLPFRIFRWQHFQPTDIDLVVTASDPDSRRVYEINGGNAATEYAAALGMRPEELTAHVFSLYPIMIQIGEEWYVRSIKQVNADGSLTFLCAIDQGLPLTIAKGVNYLEVLGEQVAALRADFGTPSLTIGCDCVLRRIEVLEKGIEQEVAGLLGQVNFLGFSTFGEQFNGLHVNQTLTGIAIGEGV